MVSGAATAAARPKRQAKALVALAANPRPVSGGTPGRRGARPDAPVPLVGHENGTQEVAPVPARGAPSRMQGSRKKPETPCVLITKAQLQNLRFRLKKVR